jgi:hypothetical protein
MATAARKEWQDWFAGDILFHRMIEDLAGLVESRAGAVLPLSRSFDVRYLRLRAREVKSNAKQTLKKLLRSSRPAVKKSPELLSSAE